MFPQTDPNGPPDIEQLIQMLASQGGYGGLPGKKPSDQLNYYQDMVSTLGFDPVQQIGLGDQPDPAEEQFTPKINKTEFTYGKDPTYAKIFELVKAGNSPAAAVTAAGIKDEVKAKEAATIAANYAGELADNLNAQQTFDAKSAKTKAKYTKPDGSKYKNAPLGGNGVYDSASEYDLMGAPTEAELMQQLASSRQFAPHAQMQQNGPQHRTADPLQVQNFTPASAGQSGRPVPYDSVNGDPNTSNAMWNPPSKAITKAKDSGTKAGNGGERSWDEPSLTPTGRTLYGNGTSANDTAAYRAAVRQRMGKAKNTQVRSDANTNAMLRVLALRTVLGG